MGRSFLLLAVLPCLGILLLAGCNNDKFSNSVQKGLDQVKDKVGQTTDSIKETVKEQANLAGSMELTLDQPLKTGRCYLALVRLSDGRPTVLQITSYQEPTDESFPSAMLRGETSAPAPAALAGQKVAVQMFLQARADGPVWHTLRDQPVELTLTSADANTFAAEITAGKLVNSDTDQAIDIRGKLSGPIVSH
jgi:hypothetical protein